MKTVFPLFLFLCLQWIPLQAEPLMEHHHWWSDDDLHLMISAEDELPQSSKEHVRYFLNFKNSWLVETEGMINAYLRKYSLQITAVDAGESSFENKHHFTVHVVLSKCKESKRQNNCKLLGFVYTSDKASKDLNKMCADKIKLEAPAFRKEWEEIGQMAGGLETAFRNQPVRSYWRALVGVK